MSQKRAFVTNGCTEYGKAAVKRLNEEGYRTGCQEEQGTEPAAAIQAFAAKWDGIDLLVLIPGFDKDAGTHSIVKTEDADFREAYQTIYKNTMFCIKEAAFSMRRNGGGSIVIVTDAAAMRAAKYDFLSGSLYAALHRSIESLALQMAPDGIRINCIAPGNVKLSGDFEVSSEIMQAIQNRLPMKRFGTVEEIMEAVLFLGSEKSSYITGTVLRCDGGTCLAGMPERREWYGWDVEKSEHYL